jgi:hypothetical protein
VYVNAYLAVLDSRHKFGTTAKIMTSGGGLSHVLCFDVLEHNGTPLKNLKLSKRIQTNIWLALGLQQAKLVGMDSEVSQSCLRKHHFMLYLLVYNISHNIPRCSPDVAAASALKLKNQYV